MRRYLAPIAPLVLFAACSQPRAREERSGPDLPREGEAMNKTPLLDRSFEPGPRIADREELLAWLAHHARESGTGRLLKLPIALTLEASGLSLGDAYLGLDPAVDRLVLRIDDSALGISLLERVEQYARSDGSCALWIEGLWLGATQSGGAFAAHAVRGPIAEDERAAAERVYVEVLVPPPDSQPAMPLPPFARKIPGTGGATTVNPGRNYEIALYEVGANFDEVTAFYRREVPRAHRTETPEMHEFSIPGAKVRVQPREGGGTLITYIVGPR